MLSPKCFSCDFVASRTMKCTGNIYITVWLVIDNEVCDTHAAREQGKY